MWTETIQINSYAQQWEFASLAVYNTCVWKFSPLKYTFQWLWLFATISQEGDKFCDRGGEPSVNLTIQLYFNKRICSCLFFCWVLVVFFFFPKGDLTPWLRPQSIVLVWTVTTIMKTPLNFKYNPYLKTLTEHQHNIKIYIDWKRIGSRLVKFKIASESKCVLKKTTGRMLSDTELAFPLPFKHCFSYVSLIFSASSKFKRCSAIIKQWSKPIKLLFIPFLDVFILITSF